MSLITLMDVKLGWEACPPEMLWEIFRHLDYKSLVKCMLVCKRWRSIVEDYAEHHSLWPKIVGRQMVNRGVTYQRKTNQDSKQILINSMLWSHLTTTLVEYFHSYEVKDFTRVHVYKDNLMVKTKTGVTYYDIPTTLVKKNYSTEDNVIDVIENDHMIVVYLRKPNEASRFLRLYGKKHCKHFNVHKDSIQVDGHVILFRAEDNICYVVNSKFIVHAYKWTRLEWNCRLVGRYYGTEYNRPCAIHVYNRSVYLITHCGSVYFANPEFRSFQKAFSYDIPLRKNPRNWTMFNRYHVVVSVDPDKNSVKNDVIQIKCGEPGRFFMVICEDMTCTTEHGNILFIGFKDGKIFIGKRSSLLADRAHATLAFNVKRYDDTLEDPAILALDVFEDKLSHTIIIATKHKILQLRISYPREVEQYFL